MIDFICATPPKALCAHIYYNTPICYELQEVLYKKTADENKSSAEYIFLHRYRAANLTSKQISERLGAGSACPALLFLGFGLCSESVVKDTLSDSDGLGCYFKELIISDKFKAVLKGELSGRNETESII